MSCGTPPLMISFLTTEDAEGRGGFAAAAVMCPLLKRRISNKEIRILNGFSSPSVFENDR